MFDVWKPNSKIREMGEFKDDKGLSLLGIEEESFVLKQRPGLTMRKGVQTSFGKKVFHEDRAGE